MDVLLASLRLTGDLLLIVLGPLALVSLGLYAIERVMASQLVSRFGWRGVLITGWIGVPLHELSHAAACVVFRHRVERLQLLAPDRVTGRLGAVEHAWDRRSAYQQLGRFFIGVAPLAGGALALWLLTLALGPPGLVLRLQPAGAGVPDMVRDTLHQAGQLLRLLLGAESLSRWPTWAYLYLCLCISAHMSPSGADLRGGWPGFLLLLVLAFIGCFIASLVGVDTTSAERLALGALAPLLALLVVALALGALTLLLVVAATAFLPRRAAAHP